MKKIILGLFIILFCFSIGVAELQEEEVKLTRKQIEKRAVISFLAEEMERLLEKVEIPREQDTKLYYEKMANVCEDLSKTFKKIAVLSREISEEEEKNKNEKELSWEEKYRMYPSTKYWLDSLKEPDERYLKKLEEQNDRLEDLMRELRNEKSDLEWDMMRYKSDLEWHMLELSSRLEFDLLFNPLLSLPFDYRYSYPKYSKKMDPINYEALLFTLSTDSKGKMDWTKYGWLKLLLKNK